MILNFFKYYETIPTLFLVANILNPRVKKSGLQNGLKIFCNFYNFLQVPNFTLDADRLFKNACDALDHLYELYEIEYGSSSGGGGLIGDDNDNGAAAIDNYCSMVQVSSCTNMTIKVNDVALYNAMQQLHGKKGENFDILGWWKNQTFLYPTLARLEKDILTPPTSESAFSACGRVLTPHRFSLSTETLEACICLKDWMQVEIRLRNITTSDEANDDDDDSD